MSRLLGLRQWLGIVDALRYMRMLEMEGCQNDFFQAYVAAGFPLRLANPKGVFYTLEDVPSGRYPRYIGETEWNDGVCQTEKGTLHSIDAEIEIAPGRWQQGYMPTGPVWAFDASIVDFDRESVSPIYHLWDHEGKSRFEFLTWGDLMLDWTEGALLFSRPHIETLVNQALGKESKTPDQVSPASYTTRLLQIQGEAVRKFWENYDLSEPDTAPDKSAIIDWLTDTKGCSQQEAQAIDLIIRHDSRKKGGAKPKG